MPPKSKKAKPKVVHVAPSKGKARKAQSLLNLVKNVGVATNDRCAFQILNADRSADQADFVDAPVNDGSPVHVFVTETSVTINSKNDASNVAGRIVFRVTPNPAAHIYYATAFDTTANNYLPTSGTQVPCEGQASFAAVYDDLRCCAMMVHVKDSSLEEKMNGVMKVANMNPASEPLKPATIDGLPGIEFPPSKLHYARVPWIPARPERDHAFVATNGALDSESTAVVGSGTYDLVATGPVQVRLRVFAIWAGRLLPDTDYIATPKMYSIDPSEVEQRLQAMFLEAPLWSQERIMARDDGTIGSIVQDGQTAFGGAKKLFGSDSSLSDRVEGGIDLVRSIGSIGSTIAGWFSIQEKVACKLASLSDEELLYAQTLLYPGRNPTMTGCPTSQMIAQLVQRVKADKLLSRGLGQGRRRTFHTVDYVPYQELCKEPAAFSARYDRRWTEVPMALADPHIVCDDLPSIEEVWLEPRDDADLHRRLVQHAEISGKFRQLRLLDRRDVARTEEKREAAAAPEEAVARNISAPPTSARSVRDELVPDPRPPNGRATTSLSSLLREGRI